MAILGFGSSTKKTSASGSKETDETEISTQTSTQQQSGQQQATTSSLDLETQNLLKEMIQSIGADLLSDEDSDLQGLVTLISERAGSSQQDIFNQISPIIDDARLQGEQELQKLQTQLAQQAGGSTANTLVASSTAVGRANLESSLAKTSGELNLSARQIQTDELSKAVQGLVQAEQGKQAPVQNISSLLNILKGSTVEQSQVNEAQSSAESELIRILDSLTKTSTESKTGIKSTKLALSN